MISVAARYGRVPMTCKLCSDPKLRKQWGCDEPTKDPLFHLECPRCATRGRRENCELCGGSNLVPHHRCPWAMMPQEVGHFFTMYNFMEAGLGFPAAGGVDDQSNVFLKAVEFVKSENAKYEEEQKRMAKMSARARARGRRRR